MKHTKVILTKDKLTRGSTHKRVENECACIPRHELGYIYAVLFWPIKHAQKAKAKLEFIYFIGHVNTWYV